MGLTKEQKEVIIIGLVSAIILLVATYIIAPFLGLDKILKELLPPSAHYILIIAMLVIAFSTPLPYRYGRAMRIAAYLSIFVFLMILELSIFKHYLQRTELKVENCTNIFFPSEKTGNLIIDTLAYTSCVFAGYVPADRTTIGWTVFILFYLLLPFGFIWTFIHALMKEIMSGWFSQTPHVIRVLSFITAIYAARTMIGGFLLTFFGYGAWGLGGIFMAIFIVKSFEHLIEKKFEIQRYKEHLEYMTKAEEEKRKIFAQTALTYLQNLKDKVEKATTPDEMKDLARQISDITNLDIWYFLKLEDRQLIGLILNNINNAALTGKKEEFSNSFKRLVDNLETWTK